MSKKVLLSAIAILCVMIGTPQGVMAKKIVYLGHQYKGDINKEKVPEGEGEIEINGLTIKGMFNGPRRCGSAARTPPPRTCSP